MAVDVRAIAIFLNVRENVALYVFGAAIGQWALGNGYFDSPMLMLVALLIAALVFWISI